MSATILIVEDEKDLVNTLEYNLRLDGYRTICAYTGKDGLDLAFGNPAPDFVLLDLMLPDTKGIEVCRRLRGDDRTHSIPVLILTAKHDEIDRIVGFEVGADDYMTKPFSVRELLLRIRVLLRRSVERRSGNKTVQELALGSLRINPSGYQVWNNGVKVALTALEYRLLFALFRRAGQVQTREALLTEAWGVQCGLTERAVDTHIARLRRKLGSAGDYIDTLRGVGYRLQERASARSLRVSKQT